MTKNVLSSYMQLHFNNESLVFAAKCLCDVGRKKSVRPLLDRVLWSSISLSALKDSFELANRAQAVELALRILAHFEGNIDASQGDEIAWLSEAWSALVEMRCSLDICCDKKGASPDNLRLSTEFCSIGCVGPFGAREDLDMLLEACAGLVEDGHKIRLLLIGLEQSFRSDFSNKIAKLNQSWLIKIDHVSHEQVAKYYGQLDTVVILRKPLAASGLVGPVIAAEALAYGKRIVISDAAPLAEYAKRYDAVMSFESGSSIGLGQTLQRSLELRAPTETSDLLSAMLAAPKSRLPEGGEGMRKDKAAAQPAASGLPLSAKQKSNLGQIDETAYIQPAQFILVGNSKQSLVSNFKVPVPRATLELSAAVVYRLKNAATKRKAVLLFEFFDRDGNVVDNIPNVGMAAAFKQYFIYLNMNSKSVGDEVQEVFKLMLPEEVASVSLSVGSFGIEDDEQVELGIRGRCYSEEAEKERSHQILERQSFPDAIIHDPSEKRYTSDLTVACILDEFTAECLSHELKLIKITQQAWQSQIEQNLPDFLLVESCWKGNDGNWGTITKGSGGSKKLGGLLRYCKQRGIPTVFWNKEDPPHYDKFGPIAEFFDLAVTTDVNMVPRYKKDFGIEVHPLSFGAQPKIHNPRPLIPRLHKAVFAGSYYEDKPKRCEDFNELMGHLERAQVPYDIFDRNFNQPISKFAFPARYQSKIVGHLPAEEVWRAHKGYKYQVNMNSVQNSATMFARRVYESLASGTPVVSNYSLGIRQLFGDIVLMPGEQSITEQLRALEASPEVYNALARRGVRVVMREHTYGHRIQEICRLLGIKVEVNFPKALLAVTASNEADIQHAKRLFDAQTAPQKHLFIELENFNTAFRFLNSSDDAVTYTMRFAKGSYTEESGYYGSAHVLKHSLNVPLAAEALEDFLYWGSGEAPGACVQAITG